MYEQTKRSSTRRSNASGVALTLFVMLLSGMACNRSLAPVASSPDDGAAVLKTPVLGKDAKHAEAPAVMAPAPQNAATAGVAVAADGQDKAKQIYSQRCLLCHGPHGQGNGVAAENLKPKPRDLREAAWQTAASDGDIRDIIVKGGAGVGKSMMMPPNPDLADQTTILAGLVSIIRSFRK